MAKVDFSGIGIVAMNGKFGNDIITRNAYGPYSRKPGPGPVQTAPLQLWQLNFQSIHAAWNSLTNMQRIAWINSAIANNRKQVLKKTLGNTQRNRQLQGFHYFMSANLNISLTGAAPINNPPTLAPLKKLTSITITALTAATFNLSWNTAATATWQLIVYCSNQMNAGRMSNNQVYMFTINKSAGTTANIIADYNIRFPNPPLAGLKLFVRAYMINSLTGQRTPPVYDSRIIV